MGAVSLQQERALPDNPMKSPEFLAAETRLRRPRDALAQRDDQIARVKARAEAAQDVIDFLMRLVQADGAGRQDIAPLAATIAQQMLQARQTIIDTRAEARKAAKRRDNQQAELDRAKARPEALRSPQGDGVALLWWLQGPGQPATARITSMTADAGWQPVYDVALDRAAGKVTLDPGLLVHQASGEDWTSVQLRLSTTQPLGQAAPSQHEPILPRLVDSQMLAGPACLAPKTDMAKRAYAAAHARARGAHPGRRHGPVAGFQGQLVACDHPAPVSLRDGAVRLPGVATFHADGALVGRGALQLTAAGDQMTRGSAR